MTMARRAYVYVRDLGQGMSEEEIRQYRRWIRERDLRPSPARRVGEWMETNDVLIVAIGMVVCFAGFAGCMVLWAVMS